MPIDCASASALTQLRAHAAERDALLARLVAQLERDKRVHAAWLFGSMGRGTPDELSDLDLFVVVRDESLDEVIAARYRMIAAMGTPLLILEAPQNRPPGGAYNMALYPGANGPHQVDWYWQRQSDAAIPRETRLLFDRVGLRRLETSTHFEYQSVPEQTPLEAAVGNVRFFWVMLLITAKYVARSPDEGRMGLLDYAWKAYAEVCDFLGIEPGQDPQAEMNPQPRAAKLSILRGLAGSMEKLMPAMQRRAGQMPVEMGSQVGRYLDLIAQGVGVSLEE
jgi:predicted nucleotidyltransferase